MTLALSASSITKENMSNNYCCRTCKYTLMSCEPNIHLFAHPSDTDDIIHQQMTLQMTSPRHQMSLSSPMIIKELFPETVMAHFWNSDLRSSNCSWLGRLATW